MQKKPTTHDRRLVSSTGIFKIEEMDLQFSNGEKRCYQRVVGSPQGAVMIVPLLNNDTLLLIREYAAGMDRYELAFPKGRIESGEETLAAANREIQEEIGYAARNLELISSVTVAPGYMFHQTHIVLASDLYPQKIEGDEPEEIEVVPWPLSEIETLLQATDFTEARSIAALFLIQRHLQQ
ncbi:MAG: ADP compounds hydrolase NudE [Candidatus Sedimenticola sp. (ex Thyasira tokunagai)]